MRAGPVVSRGTRKFQAPQEIPFSKSSGTCIPKQSSSLRLYLKAGLLYICTLASLPHTPSPANSASARSDSLFSNFSKQKKRRAESYRNVFAVRERRNVCLAEVRVCMQAFFKTFLYSGNVFHTKEPVSFRTLHHCPQEEDRTFLKKNRSRTLLEAGISRGW